MLTWMDPNEPYLLCAECFEYTPVPSDEEFECEHCGCPYSRALTVEGGDGILN